MRRVHGVLLMCALLLCGCKQVGPHQAADIVSATPAAPSAIAPLLPGGATPLPAITTSVPASSAARPVFTPTPPYGTASVPHNTDWIADLSFADPDHGWALGSTCQSPSVVCRRSLWHTADGGQIWSELATPTLPPIPPYAGTHPDVSKVLFVTARDGLVYGPDLLATHDGGATWTTMPMPKGVAGMSYQVGVLWALLGQPCLPRDTLLLCAPEIVRSRDLGQTWQPFASQPDLHGVMPLMLRSDHGHAWLITDHIERTADDGASWSSAELPVGCRPRALRTLASFAGGTLWLDCVLGASAGAEGRGIYTSTDFGVTWTQAFPPTGTPTSLNTSGYSIQLVAVSNRRAFLGLDRYALEVTDDGGRTWRPAIAPGDGYSRALVFADVAHGWYATLAGEIWRTEDGGAQWQRVVLP